MTHRNFTISTFKKAVAPLSTLSMRQWQTSHHGRLACTTFHRSAMEQQPCSVSFKTTWQPISTARVRAQQGSKSDLQSVLPCPRFQTSTKVEPVVSQTLKICLMESVWLQYSRVVAMISNYTRRNCSTIKWCNRFSRNSISTWKICPRIAVVVALTRTKICQSGFRA